MARVVGSETMLLWCRKCYRLRCHNNLVWRGARPPLGRNITAKCSECGYRDREGYVIYERQEAKESFE